MTKRIVPDPVPTHAQTLSQLEADDTASPSRASASAMPCWRWRMRSPPPPPRSRRSPQPMSPGRPHDHAHAHPRHHPTDAPRLPSDRPGLRLHPRRPARHELRVRRRCHRTAACRPPAASTTLPASMDRDGHAMTMQHSLLSPTSSARLFTVRDSRWTWRAALTLLRRAAGPSGPHPPGGRVSGGFRLMSSLPGHDQTSTWRPFKQYRSPDRWPA